MSERPTLQVLMDRIRSDIVSRMQADDVLRRSDAEVYARVEALTVHALYGYADWIMDQIFPDTCDESMLPRLATFWKVPQKPAAVAIGTLTFSTAIGAIIDTTLQVIALDGTLYAPTVSVTASAGSTTVAAQAVTAGAAGNRVGGQSVLLTQPRDGVQTVATCGDMTGGADIETVDSWRARIITAWREPPAAGTANDYVNWALDVPGVTQAWAYPLEMGLGSVIIRCMMGASVPSTEDTETIQAYIDSVRPVGPPDDCITGVVVTAPTLAPQNFTIHLDPDTPDIRAAVQAELADLFLRDGAPGTSKQPCTIYLSQIREAVSQAAGEIDSTVSVPTADIVISSGGQLPTVGTITWV